MGGLSSIQFFLDFWNFVNFAKPLSSLFRVVHWFQLISSPLTPSPGSDTWRCTRVGPDASHPASMLTQSMHPSTGPQGCHSASPEPPVVRFTGLESVWVQFILCGVVQDVPVLFSLLYMPRRGWLLSALGRQGRGWSPVSSFFCHNCSPSGDLCGG